MMLRFVAWVHCDAMLCKSCARFEQTAEQVRDSKETGDGDAEKFATLARRFFHANGWQCLDAQAEEYCPFHKPKETRESNAGGGTNPLATGTAHGPSAG